MRLLQRKIQISGFLKDKSFFLVLTDNNTLIKKNGNFSEPLSFFSPMNSIRNSFKNFYNSLKNPLVYKLFPLRGGGKKHKKKVYTKPKKKKHVHKKIKLRILTYFNSREGKIEKLRKNSPQAPGCFMAVHFNRVTCGKTGLTFIRNS
jgi:ribosomal protein S27AE